MEAELHTFLTLALDGGEWSASRADSLNPGSEEKNPWTLI
jgi:hypothetical protein